MNITRRAVLPVLALTAALAAAILPNALARAHDDGRPRHKPLVSISGPDSAITEKRHALIRTQKDFDALWREHLGAKAPAPRTHPNTPQIDWDRCMVLALFRGRAANTNGEFIADIIEHRAHTVVRFDSYTFQTASFEPGVADTGVPTVPYGIFILPRLDTPIVLEENTQGLLGHPPVWTERGRLE